MNSRIEAPVVWRKLTFGGRMSRRTALVLWISAAAGAAMFASWGWLVAAGLASLVLVFLPCAAMCAFGLCSGSKCDPEDRVVFAPAERRDA